MTKRLKTYRISRKLVYVITCIHSFRMALSNPTTPHYRSFSHSVHSPDNLFIYLFISSPEPSGSQGELIVYPCSVVRPSVVRRPHFSKIFFSETAWPIKAKFYMKHLWEGGTNVYINNLGHMTKMAAMPIYGKNPSKIFFSGTTGPISTKLGMKHR